jgi:hypothetical protein
MSDNDSNKRAREIAERVLGTLECTEAVSSITSARIAREEALREGEVRGVEWSRAIAVNHKDHDCICDCYMDSLNDRISELGQPMSEIAELEEMAK